jgi:N-carbamoylputrescine amidase
MKIALIQQEATTNLEENRSRGLEAVERAAAAGANIVCFAELAFDPFYPQVPATEDSLARAETIPGPTTDRFAQKAKELGVVIVLNVFERDGEATYDTSPVIGTDGSIMGKTRMVHITDYPCFYEQGYYTPGDMGAPVYQTDFGVIGVAICYDRHYPEYMRALALQGAEVVFVPQAGAVGEWPEGLFEAEMRVVAFQNGYYTALCNRVGEEPQLAFAGGSFVCSPSGRVIARASEGTEAMLLASINAEAIKNSHARRLFLKDRRPALYEKWLR